MKKGVFSDDSQGGGGGGAGGRLVRAGGPLSGIAGAGGPLSGIAGAGGSCDTLARERRGKKRTATGRENGAEGGGSFFFLTSANAHNSLSPSSFVKVTSTSLLFPFIAHIQCCA